jgi:PAS domain S-box-containing protein
MRVRAVHDVMTDAHVVHVRPEGDLLGGDLAELSIPGRTVRVDVVASVAQLHESFTDGTDLVVTEYSLPGRETGLDVLSRVRNVDPDLPVVLCTGDPDGEVASAATRLGVTEYVPRATDSEESLRDRVTDLLGRDARTDGGTAAVQRYADPISDVISDAVVTIDADSRIVYANAAAADLTGYDRDSLVGNPFTDLMPEGMRDRHVEAVTAYAATGDRQLGWDYLELSVLDRDGTEIPVTVSFSEEVMDGERYFTGVIRDVSEREERERRLERTNTRLDLALDAIDGGVFVWDAAADELEWDAQTASLFGLAAEDRTVDPERLHELTVPEHRGRLDAVIAAAQAGVDDHEVTYRIERPDGERRWVETHATAVRNDDGSVARLVGITRDVTERRETAADLRESQTALQRLYEITADPDRGFAAKRDAILELGCERLDLPLGFLTDIEDGDLEIVAAHGHDDLAGHTAPLDGEYCAETVETGLAATTDAADDAWATDAYETYGLACYIGGEIVVDGATAGTICFASESPREREFTDFEETFVELATLWLGYEGERRARAAELRDAHDQKDRVLERIDAGFFAVDTDWEFTYFNSRAEDILGLTAGEVLGENVWDAFPEAIERTFYDEYQAAMETQTPTTFEEYFPPLDVWFAVSAYPSSDGLSVYFEDVTERKRREIELERYETVMETVQHMVYVLDADGRFTHVSGPFAERLDYEREALVGTDAATVIGDPDDLSAVRDEIRHLRTPDGPRNTDVEVDLTTADGATFPAAVEISLLPGDSFEGTVGVVQDVTELRATRAELADERDRFTYLFDNLPDGVVEAEMVDGEPIVQSTNDAFGDLFGYDLSRMQGSSLNEHVLTPDEEAAGRRLDDRAANGDRIQEEVCRETADGERYFLFRGVPYDVGADDTRVFGIYTDITEQRHRERQLQVLTRVLRHNVRNELTVILGQADQLRLELDDEDKLEMVDTVLDTAREVATMSEKSQQIEQVIGHSASDRTVDVATVARRVAATYGQEYPDATVSVDAPDALPVRGDSQLESAVGNLVENAIVHNDDDSPRVEIAVGAADGTATVSVADDGPGIPETERAVITGDDDITQLTHGSGIGLWLVRWIAESCGGELSFADTAAGSEVALTLDTED